MRPSPERTNITLVGYWNRMIFTPPWVDAHIFRLEADEELQLHVPIVPVAPIKFESQAATLEVSMSRLVIIPKEPTVDGLCRSEMMAVSLLSDLPDTPIRATGVNFGFDVPAPSTKLRSLLFQDDIGRIEQLGSTIEKRRISRTVVMPDRTLNITLGIQGAANLQVDLNYHVEKAVRPAREANREIDGQVLVLRQHAVELLRDVYNLALSE